VLDENSNLKNYFGFLKAFPWLVKPLTKLRKKNHKLKKNLPKKARRRGEH